MRLPWLQIDDVAFTRGRTLGRMLGVGEHTGLGMLVLLWQWALELAPEGDFSGAINSPLADQMLAAALGWVGEPKRLVECLEAVGCVACETDASACVRIRVRGLDRYRDAAARSKSRTEGAKRAAESRWNAERMRTQCERNADAMRFDAKTETKTETESEEDRNHAPPAESRLALVTPPVEPPKAKPKRAKATDTPEVLELREAWNSITTPPIARWTAGRADVALEALKRRPLAEWREVFRLVEASAFCRGSTGFVASIDFVLRPEGKKPETALRVLEGAYASAPPSSARATTGAAYRTPGATVTDSDTSWEADLA